MQRIVFFFVVCFGFSAINGCGGVFTKGDLSSVMSQAKGALGMNQKQMQVSMKLQMVSSHLGQLSTITTASIRSSSSAQQIMSGLDNVSQQLTGVAPSMGLNSAITMVQSRMPPMVKQYWNSPYYPVYPQIVVFAINIRASDMQTLVSYISKMLPQMNTNQINQLDTVASSLQATLTSMVAL